MAGYIYCMKNDHPSFGRFVKVGYTERSPAQRVLELRLKWRCKFEVLWDMDVIDPLRAERFLHEFLHKVRVRYEFFAIDPEYLKQCAERFFDDRWRETEGEMLPPSLDEQVAVDLSGHLLEPADETMEDELEQSRRDMDLGR
jgi:hypothetical protein